MIHTVALSLVVIVIRTYYCHYFLAEVEDPFVLRQRLILVMELEHRSVNCFGFQV